MAMEFSADLYALIGQFPPSSPAWSLADAFDAVTNGIENPEAMKRMQGLDSAEMEPWKNLVSAIEALYQDDPERCAAALEHIADASAPGSLKPLFRACLSRQDSSGKDRLFTELSSGSDAAVDLYRRLIMPKHPLAMLAFQAEDALLRGRINQFETMAGRIMRSLRELRRIDGSLLALRYGIYCLKLLDTHGGGGEEFFPIVLDEMGRADGFCTLGLALTGKNNEAAVSALRASLDSGEGLFMDKDMRGLIRDLVNYLEKGLSLPPDSGRGSGAEPEDPEKQKKAVQLELF
ncbi:hypothetical protein LJC14_04355 [Treponema sp. OttesenSCG-928-L16]|nr:hypothetical protein [Treponema sp. OttesenSCG-928-L16]